LRIKFKQLSGKNKERVSTLVRELARVLGKMTATHPAIISALCEPSVSEEPKYTTGPSSSRTAP